MSPKPFELKLSGSTSFFSAIFLLHQNSLPVVGGSINIGSSHTIIAVIIGGQFIFLPIQVGEK